MAHDIEVDVSKDDTSRPKQRRTSSSVSDAEYQHALEVILETDNAGRRKSSLTQEEAEKLAKAKEEQTADTACRVHALLGHKDQLDKASVRHSIRDVQKDRKFDKGREDVDGEHLRTRLLSKKQLSDMAYGVRELSKKLGSVRLRVQVKTILLLTKAHDDELIGLTREVAEWLLSDDRNVKYTVYIEDTMKDNKKFNVKDLQSRDSYSERIKFWDADLCRKKPETFDFVISLGGDGTVLYASWLFQRVVPPVLSFSLGSLGFLTKFDFANYPDTLTRAFTEGVLVSLRLRFEGTVMRSQHNGDHHRDLVNELIGEEKDDEHTHRADGSHEVLNEIVVDRGPNATLSAIELFGDEQHFTTVQADGVCVATPTGSTAYNLAAGGSLCHPDNPVILITAICAHTLSFRPIIMPDTVILRLGVPYDARTSSWASFDGRERVELHPGDYVTISASRYPFANVMPMGNARESWIGSITRTLQWNTRQRQKAFTDG